MTAIWTAQIKDLTSLASNPHLHLRWRASKVSNNIVRNDSQQKDQQASHSPCQFSLNRRSQGFSSHHLDQFSLNTLRLQHRAAEDHVSAHHHHGARQEVGRNRPARDDRTVKKEGGRATEIDAKAARAMRAAQMNRRNGTETLSLIGQISLVKHQAWDMLNILMSSSVSSASLKPVELMRSFDGGFDGRHQQTWWQKDPRCRQTYEMEWQIQLMMAARIWSCGSNTGGNSLSTHSISG